MRRRNAAPACTIGSSYARHGHVRTGALPGLLIGGALGAVLGALAAHQIKAPLLSRLFAILLLFVAAQMIVRPSGAKDAPQSSGGVS